MTPHHPESERYLISVCIQNNSRIDDCIEAGIVSGSFYTPKCSILWSCICDIYRKGDAVDEVTLFDYLEANETSDGQKQINLIGGVQELASISSHVAVDTSFKSHLERVKTAHKRRLLISACQQSLELAKDDSEPILDQIGRIEAKVLSVSGDEAESELCTAAEIADEEYKRIVKINSSQVEEGIKTGYVDIDRRTGGFRNGEMIILAARPSAGKTSLGMNITENLCLQGKHCLVFSVEMSKGMLMRRMLFAQAKVDMRKLGDRLLTHQDLYKLEKAKEKIKSINLTICEKSDINIAGIQSYARSVHKRRKLDFIMIDYAQLIAPLEKSFSREREVAAISMGIVQLRKQLNIPILLLAQLNRDCEKNKRWPTKADLRESGQLEQDADMILFLSQLSHDGKDLPQQEQGREIDFIVAKNRNGPTGFCKLLFKGDHTRFYNHASEREGI